MNCGDVEWELATCLTGNELHLRVPGEVMALCSTWPVLGYQDCQPGERAWMEAHPGEYVFCARCLDASCPARRSG